MRQIFLIALLSLVFIIGVAGAAPAVQAQDVLEQAIQEAETLQPDVVGTYPTDEGASLNADISAKIAADKAAQGKSLDFPPEPEVDGIFAKTMTFIMGLFASLLGIAMVTLNYAVYYTVIKMGDYVHNLAAIGVTWRILRDIANIMFIFGFIGAGIATILNVDQYGWKTKMLPMLLVGAIFLNFSLFITEAMIDGTNLFATQFYTQINNGQQPTADTLGKHGISDKIMQQLGLQTLYDARLRSDILTAKNSIYIAFMGIILFIVTAFVMFSLAFILFARFVALIFFIILCPVAFMGLAIPQMQYRANQWWKNFLEQIITAPVLMLLLYVALAVITDESFLSFGTQPDWKGIVSDTSGSMNLAGLAGAILSFIVAIGLLLVVVIKAKSMSAFGAGMATKAASRLSGATLMAAGLAKGSRYVGRNTFGRAGNTRIGKALGMGGLANASFDFRNSKLAKTTQTRTGLDLGTGGKGGYKTYAAEQQKSQRKKLVGTNLRKAEGAEAAAVKAHSRLQTQYDTAAAEYAKQKAEVERLETVNKSNREKGIFDQQNTNDLKTAQQNLATSKESFEATVTALADAEATLKRTQEATERMREKIDKIEERSELQELKDALKEGAAKASTEGRTEKKEAKPEEKK